MKGYYLAIAGTCEEELKCTACAKEFGVDNIMHDYLTASFTADLNFTFELLM